MNRLQQIREREASLKVHEKVVLPQLEEGSLIEVFVDEVLTESYEVAVNRLFTGRVALEGDFEIPDSEAANIITVHEADPTDNWKPHSHSLDDLSDVIITSAVSGDYIRYNGTNWVDVTISQVLTDIKTVDGSGSGLDADLLDGLDSTAFALSDHNLLSATHGDTLAGSPVLGDLIHGNATPKWARLAGNTTTTRKFLRQVGDGVNSAVPAWDTIASGDLPTLTANRVVVTDGTGVITTDADLAFDGTDLSLGSLSSLKWSTDVILLRGTADTLDMRNGANAQRIRLYGNYVSGTNLHRLVLGFSPAEDRYMISTENLGAQPAKALSFWTDSTERWQINTSGHLLAITNNFYDIGDGVTDPRDLHLTRALKLRAATNQIVFDSDGAATGTLTWTPATSGKTITLPNATGTVAVSATAPVTLSATGDIGITGAALTKTDDTNVTLTLGGTPSTALLVAASITVGWTGDLAFSRFVQATAASKLVGRGSAAGAGDYEEITLGSGLTMTGTTLSSSGGGGTPGGADTQVQFNDAAAFGGDAGFTFTKATDIVTIGTGTALQTFKGTQVGGASTTDNAIRVLHTYPVVLTADIFGARFEWITAGSSAFSLIGLQSRLEAGYTGAKGTIALYGLNSVAGTGTNEFSNTDCNHGFIGLAQATTTGTNLGVKGSAVGGNESIGVFGLATTAKNSATNIGVAGFGLNTGTTPIQIGGYFGLQSAAPTYASAALMCDNGSEASDIFVARDNGTPWIKVLDGGSMAYLELTPAQITANQNDYDPGRNSFWRISSDAARNITGIAGGSDGRRLIIVNVGSFNITLVHQSASSVAANRIITHNGLNVVVSPNDGITLIYDATASRWRRIALDTGGV